MKRQSVFLALVCSLLVAGQVGADPPEATGVTVCNLGVLAPSGKALFLPGTSGVEAIAVFNGKPLWEAKGAGVPLLATADATSGLRLSYAAEGDPTAGFGFAARVVPENVTLLAKTANQTSGGNDWSERLITAKRGETVGSILRELGAAPDEIKLILAVFGTLSIDGKRRRKLGAAWDGFAAQTSGAPFAAIATGRQTLKLGEIGWWRLGVAVIVWGALVFAHPMLFGVSPLPGS